jgi:putative DNA methylase
VSEAVQYPKRLIEVDLPIKRISAHARREKSIRHGHISTLHIWWARRPLASCRAVICTALWPDPADPLCPEAFRRAARDAMLEWTTHETQKLLSQESRGRFEAARKDRLRFDDPSQVRLALLDFVADFANWDNSTIPEFLQTSRKLTSAAHEALGGVPGSRPMVVDPFAGGGSIPLEALRVGADAFASDLNPVAVLLIKVLLEYIPKYGPRLSNDLRKAGDWVKQKVERDLAGLYPREPDGTTPVAYLWARTINCEGPGCGAEVPLMRSRWLSKPSVALQLVPCFSTKRVDFRIIIRERGRWVNQDDTAEIADEPRFDGTVKRGSATCPCCGYTTPVESVRAQLKARRGGACSSRMYCVVTAGADRSGRRYRLPLTLDLDAARLGAQRLSALEGSSFGSLSAIPNEPIATTEPRRVSVPAYGMTHWRDLFNQRQLVALVTLTGEIRQAVEQIHGPDRSQEDTEYSKALKVLLGLCVDRCADKLSAQVVWHTGREFVDHVFARQAIPIVWEFAEANVFGDVGLSGAIEWICRVIDENVCAVPISGIVSQASATHQQLPDDSAHALVTDPPYYYSVPYSHLADFFYVWLKRTVGDIFPEYFLGNCTPKDKECVQDLPHAAVAALQKDRAFYEKTLRESFEVSRRVTRPDAIGIVVFAHTNTAAWEALIAAMISAGWVVTGSWPIDTEMATRLLAKRQSSLASSVHIVCRPRENAAGAVRDDDVGDWRQVLAELPRRIHNWMPRLAAEGVVGADAIFACIGPALEVFSRHSRVERANGEVVSLGEYLEQVWAAVSREALSMIFADPETSGLDEDARLTAMWLWTIAAPSGAPTGETEAENDTESDQAEDDERPVIATSAVGFTLEFDAARKIAQGLGARLEALQHVVQVKADKARLLSVAERATYLFGGSDAAPTAKKTPKKKPQRALFEELEEVAEQQGWGEVGTPRAGSTTLDRVHQAMILFGAGRGEALKRFLVEEGVGQLAQFWKLAQALSALYPAGTDEKRWVDGVLARKKGLGF